MVDNDTSLLEGAAGDREVSIEPESRSEELLGELARRWKNWSVVAVTAVTTYYLYTVDGGWTLDAITFALITAGLLGYTLLTLTADIE